MEELADALQDIIEDVAREESTIYYSQAMEAVGLRHSNQGHRSKFSKAMHIICSRTTDEQGFMLCSIIVSKTTQMPSESFFKYAEKIGAKDINVSRETFWENQKKLVYNSYK